MFAKSDTRKNKLQRKFEKLMAESHRLASSNRRKSDEKMAQAEAILRSLDAIDPLELEA